MNFNKNKSCLKLRDRSIGYLQENTDQIGIEDPQNLKRFEC